MKQTTLDLNGPILSFIKHPESVSVANAGIVTFVGIATATFPDQIPANPASNTGYISYQWYDQNGPISNGTNVTGSASTTLTISNIVSPTDNNRRINVKADYIPSAYQSSSPVTAGTARSTGNAINDALYSNSAVLTVYPLLSIATQPTSQTAAQTKTATFTALGQSNDNITVTYQWYIDGTAVIDGTNSISGATFTVSGATSSTLSVSGSTVSTYNVNVKVSHPTASNSPLSSNTVTFTVVSARLILNVELNPGAGGKATLYSWNLFDQGSFSIGPAQVPAPNIMCFYAPEKDIDVYLDISANSGSDYGSYKGGQGGSSTLKLTLKQNIEYIITSISQVNTGSGIFVYRKGTLIAVVGGGGNAGSGGNGGDGGGVNIAGADGSGRGGGKGGILYTSGTLPSNGVFGSTVNNSSILKPGDGQASVPYGGRVLPCPKGYWYDRGYSACADVGYVKFYAANGTKIDNSTDTILRGFKSGYGIRNTAGAGSGGGDGGNGATGGNGGTSGGGGGGGSGYTDGSVEIVSTRQGGNTGLGGIVIRSAS